MKFFKNLLVAFAFISVFCGCRKGKIVSSVEKENLFELNYGTFEDELNVFNMSSAGNINTSISMQDGFFYILNLESNKIIDMNIYRVLFDSYNNT